MMIPFYLRASKDGKKAECKLLFSVKPSQAKKWNPTTERLDIKGSSINKYLDDVEREISMIIDRHRSRLHKLTAKQIKDLITESLQPKQELVSLRTFIWNYLDKEIKQNGQYSHGTYKSYKKAINHLDRYLELNNELDFHNFFYSAARGFANYLMSDKPEIGRKGMTEVSAHTIVKRVKRIFKNAIDRGFMEENPFLKIKLSSESPCRSSAIFELFGLKNKIEFCLI